MFKPGGARDRYLVNPYRVIRFKNTSSFVLEPGPISLFAGGSFVGEALSGALSAGSTATLPFAVEPSIRVSQSSQSGAEIIHSLKVSKGVLEVESFNQTVT